MPKKNETTDHVADMQAATARAARPRKTPEQRLAEARAKAMRAEFDVLAAKAEAANLPRRHVAAIKSAIDLVELLGLGDVGLPIWQQRIEDIVAEAAP